MNERGYLPKRKKSHHETPKDVKVTIYVTNQRSVNVTESKLFKLRSNVVAFVQTTVPTFKSVYRSKVYWEMIDLAKRI